MFTAPTKNLRRIGLPAFVAVLFAYCTGGRLVWNGDLRIRTSLPLTFLIVVPFLFSVPISLATAEMTTIMPVEGEFYRWIRVALGDFGVSSANGGTPTGTFLTSAIHVNWSLTSVISSYRPGSALWRALQETNMDALCHLEEPSRSELVGRD